MRRFLDRLTPLAAVLASSVFVALSTGYSLARGEAAARSSRSDVVLVTIDTLRADRLGSYGYRQARTPALDGLAAEGVRFERAFSAVPLTLPSHTSLMTGTYPFFHGVRDNSGYVLSPRAMTLAEMMKAAGYQTAAFVGAFVLDSKFGLDQGFDDYWDDFDLSHYENISPGYIQHTANQVVDQAIGWLERRRDSQTPFFLWVHLYDPHDPYSPPEPYASRHPGQPYDGEIEFTDANIAKILQWLKEKKLYDNSLIVVAADHGESLGEHQEEKHGLFIYNATLQVPLIVRLPGGQSAGQTVDANVSLIDIFPTVAQVLRLDRKLVPPLQGRGLLSLMMGKNRESVSLYAESLYGTNQFGWSPLRALIGPDHKYVLAPQPELYDLKADFQERKNLAASQQGLARSFQQNLQELTTRLASPEEAMESAAKMDAETRARLSSLGYVSLSSGSGRIDDYESLPDPKTKITLYNRITSLFELSAQGKYGQVIPAYQKILEQEPNLKIVRYKLGQAYFFTEQFLEALEQFKKVIQLGGDDSLATFDLAQTYLKLNRIDEAIPGFKQTLELDPSHYRARTNLGVLYKNQGKIPEAIEQFEKALEVAPDAVLVLGNLGVSYALAGREQEGIDTLQKAISLAPENAFLHANLGLVFRKMGNEEEARRQLDIARRLDPGLFRKR